MKPVRPGQIWLFCDFDNCLMGTEQHAVPSLIARFNTLYGPQISEPLTFDTFKENFHGQAREVLCENLSSFYNINVDNKLLYEKREWNMMNHYQGLKDKVQIAPNAVDALSDLKNADVKLAFVSNNPIQRALAAMRYADCGRGDELANLFGTSFYEAGDVMKPKPDVYLHAMAQEGADAAHSFAIEDSVTGMKSAVGAGITTFGYTGFSDKPEKLAGELRAAGATEIYANFAALPHLIQTHLPKGARLWRSSPFQPQP